MVLLVARESKPEMVFLNTFIVRVYTKMSTQSGKYWHVQKEEKCDGHFCNQIINLDTVIQTLKVVSIQS